MQWTKKIERNPFENEGMNCKEERKGTGFNSHSVR